LKATVSEPESWKRIIDIEVPEQEINSAFEKKLNDLKRNIKLPGFRPGKVPPALIKQRFGPSIREEVIEELIQKSFKDACDQNNINPVSQPKIHDLKATEGEALSFSIETEVDPEIEIKDYNKLKIKTQPEEIKDSDVEESLRNLLERFAEFKDTERPAQKGDYVKLEYLKVLIDGNERTDISFPKYPVELGGENRIEDFDDGIIGHSADEIIDLKIKFPDEYADTQVAGKEGEFKIRILSVQQKSLPEVNEEFLQKIGDFKSEDELREQIRKNLQQEALRKAKEEAYDQAINTLIEKNSFDVPPARIEQFIDYVYNQTLQHQLPNTPALSREEFAERYKEVALRSIKRQRIIDYIANKENIKATSEEVDNEIRRLAEMYNYPFEPYKQQLRKNGSTLRIREELREEKTLDFLIGEYTPEKED
jgi:trigger factor